MMTKLDCTVVIPSSGRPTLGRAIHSALAQRDANVEVIVVLNGVGVAVEVPNEDVRLIHAPGATPNESRQLGIANARADVVALLDDDDWWCTSKLRTQLARAAELEVLSPGKWFVGCGLTEVLPSQVRLSPRRLRVGITEPAAVYLFGRRSIRSARNQLQTSTLVFPKQLGMHVPWSARAKIHMDWGWVLDAEAAGAIWDVVPQYLVGYDRTMDGVTRQSRAADSVDWASRYLADRPRERGDFIGVISAGFAARAGRTSEMLSAVRLAYFTARPRLATSVVVAANVARLLQRREK